MNAEGVYGTQGMPSNTNAPGARYSLVGLGRFDRQPVAVWWARIDVQ